MDWLDNREFDEIGRCAYSTMVPPQGAKPMYREVHEVVDELFDAGEDERAWKLHFLIIRMLFWPTKSGSSDADTSASQLVKDRCHSFMRGEWRHLWHEATHEARLPKAQTAGQVEDAAEQQRRMDVRARMFARQGQLAKAMGVFETGAVLDPRDGDVMAQLERLQAPPTEFAEFPEEPEGLRNDDAFRYKLGTVQVPTSGGGTVEQPTMAYVKSRLKGGIAQSLSGARYEHYECLPTATLERMVDKILNGETAEGPRSVITACRGLAPDKGGRKVRPVAIGEAIRRIAGRVVCVQDNAAIAEMLTPVMQFGVAVKAGIEYAYHSVRQHMMATYDEYEQQYMSGDGDEDEVPGVLKVDFKNGYNSTQRSKMMAQVEVKLPRLLRFTRYCYAQEGTVVFMYKGKSVKELKSKFGSQQGDPLGGHYFALSIFDFMQELHSAFPEACKSWIVDDLTVSDKQGQLAEVAKFIAEKGPAYGLFKNETKGEFYTPFSARNTAFRPSDVITRQHGYKHAPNGFDKLLGAPLGDAEFEAERALDIAKELTAGAQHLKRIQDAQMEYVLLKHCVCTVITHLPRMLEPGTVKRAIEYHERAVRAQFGRIVIEAARKQQDLPDMAWEWAQQPVAQGGCGLRCLRTEAPAGYLAAMGAVARRATKIHENTGSGAAATVRKWFDDNREFESLLDQMAEQVNGASEHGCRGDTPNDKLCPSLAALEKMPRQFQVSEKLYGARKRQLLDEPSQSDEVRALRLSNCQFNAGAWLNCIPTGATNNRFKCSTEAFKVMLQMRLCIFLAFSKGVEVCTCGEGANASFLYGWHWCTRCGKACRVRNHHRVRDIIAEMYRSLGVDAETEQGGMYQQWTSYNEYKPADCTVPGSATKTGNTYALDVAITDPTGKTAVRRQSHRQPLKAAETRHKAKMDRFQQQLAMTGGTITWEKIPLVFEITGAMGTETQTWWREVVALEKQQRGGEAASRKDRGLEWTFSANGFASFWLQSISMSMARTQAESVLKFIHKNQKAGVLDIHPDVNVN